MANEAWKRPRTSRVYLHPPLSGRLVLLYPEGKITHSALLDNGTHLSQPGCGVILLHGEEMDAFDFRTTRFGTPQGGVPIYTLDAEAEDGAAVTLEAFCDFGRYPAAYFSVTVTNPTNAPIAGCLGVLPRSGRDDAYLSQLHQEGYAPYDPNVKNFYMLRRTWRADGEGRACDTSGLAGGDAALELTADAALHVRWIADGARGHMFEAADYFRVEYSLAPGESARFTGRLSAGGEHTSDYGAARAAAEAQWREIQSRVRVLPATDNVVWQEMYRHLAAQCCQMLALYEGDSLPAARQGDLGRYLWPYESVITLMFLDRIGLREHTGDAYRYFCERWLTREGEDRGRIRSGCGAWENFTGSVLWGLSEHLRMSGDAAELAEFLPDLMSMYGWIRRRRRIPSDGYAGLFPVGRGSDWADHAQFWTFTDSYNAMAIGAMADMLAGFGRPEADAVRAEYEDYRARLLEIRDELYRGHEEDEMFLFPHELGLTVEETQTYSYYTDGAPMLLMTGIIEPGSRMMAQMEAYFRRRGQFERGLCGRMTSCESAWDGAYHGGYGDVWYTVQSEWLWVNAWLKAGQREAVEETMRGLLRYGITEQYVVSERYCSVNEWYAPWQPNGSGSARMAQLLLAWLGEAHI